MKCLLPSLSQYLSSLSSEVDISLSKSLYLLSLRSSSSIGEYIFFVLFQPQYWWQNNTSLCSIFTLINDSLKKTKHSHAKNICYVAYKLSISHQKKIVTRCITWIVACFFVCLLKAYSPANRTGPPQGFSQIQILHVTLNLKNPFNV